MNPPAGSAPGYGPPPDEEPAYGGLPGPPFASAPHEAYLSNVMPADPQTPLLLIAPEVTERASRLRVAFRLVLALPHLLVAGLASYVMLLLVLPTWFAALVAGRVPDGLYRPQAGLAQYFARVTGYLRLLTDRWPGFSHSTDDPVQLLLPGPSQLNRAAVLFRIVLVIPVYLAAAVVSSGITVLAVIGWLATLVLGRLPRPLFEAIGSGLRFETRFYAYGLLLTSAYPSGLFQNDPTPAADEPANPSQPVPPVLSTGGRRWLVAAIVAGALGYTAVIASGVVAGVQRVRVEHQFAAAYKAINPPSLASCTTDGCRRQALRATADEFRAFGARLDAIDFPSDVQPELTTLKADLAAFVSDLERIAAGSAASAAVQDATGRVRADVVKLDTDVTALDRALLRPSGN